MAPGHRLGAGGDRLEVEHLGRVRHRDQELEVAAHRVLAALAHRARHREQPRARRDQRVGDALERGEEALQLVGEVIVERALGGAGARHDVADRDVGVALLGDQLDDRLEQALALRRRDQLGSSLCRPRGRIRGTRLGLASSFFTTVDLGVPAATSRTTSRGIGGAGFGESAGAAACATHLEMLYSAAVTTGRAHRAIDAVWRIESARLIAGARAHGARRRRSPRSWRRTRWSRRSSAGRRRACPTTRAPG